MIPSRSFRDLRRYALLCLSALTLLLLLSGCAGLMYERAEIDPGFSGGVGADFGDNTYVIVSQDGPIPDITPNPEVVLDARYGFSEQVGIFGRFALGYQFWRTPYWNQWGNQTNWTGEAQIGAKVRVAYPDGGAFRIAVGLPNLVDVKYLWDLNPQWTLNAGLALPRGASFGATWHIPVSALTTCHVAGEVSFPPSAAIGVAFGFPR